MLTDEMRAAGWIEHDGGPCPVPLDSKPRVKMRGKRYVPIEPSGSGKAQASDWVWEMRGHLKIIAYRPEPRHD